MNCPGALTAESEEGATGELPREAQWRAPAGSGWRTILLVVALASPLIFFGLGNHDFWITDEPFVAEVAREMAVTGDVVVPRLNGEPFLEKPPLYYGTVALCYEALGVTPLAARLPSALFSMGTLLATFALGVRLFGRREGFWGALLLSTSYLFSFAGHFSLVDPALSFFVTLAFLAGVVALEGRTRPWALPALWFLGGLAFMSKGFVGPAFLLTGISAAAAWRREWRFFSPRAHALGVVLFLAVTLPWVVALWREGGGAYLREALVANSVGRCVPVASLLPRGDSLGTHDQPVYAYAESLLTSVLPWTPLLLLGMVQGAGSMWPRAAARGGEREDEREARSGYAFLLCALGANLALLSLPSYKRGMYLLPLLPLAAVLMGRALATLGRAREESEHRWVRVLVVAQVVTAALVGLGLPVLYLVLEATENSDVLGVVPWVTAGVWILVSGVILAAALRCHSEMRMDRMAAMLWALVACGLVAFLILGLPVLERQRTMDGFFHEAARKEAGRKATPELLLNNESYIGLACLHFGGVIPDFGGGERGPAPSSQGEVDVITDAKGLRELRSSAGASVKILCCRVDTRPGADRSLYLVSYEGARGSDDPGRH